MFPLFSNCHKKSALLISENLSTFVNDEIVQKSEKITNITHLFPTRSNNLQWGSEYRPFEYQKHLNTKLFEIRISYGIMVWYSNVRSMGYVLCTRPTIRIPDQYIRKQDGIQLSSIQTKAFIMLSIQSTPVHYTLHLHL